MRRQRRVPDVRATTSRTSRAHAKIQTRRVHDRLTRRRPNRRLPAAVGQALIGPTRDPDAASVEDLGLGDVDDHRPAVVCDDVSRCVQKYCKGRKLPFASKRDDRRRGFAGHGEARTPRRRRRGRGTSHRQPPWRGWNTILDALPGSVATLPEGAVASGTSNAKWGLAPRRDRRYTRRASTPAALSHSGRFAPQCATSPARTGIRRARTG